jgi:hypothetical protein
MVASATKASFAASGVTAGGQRGVDDVTDLSVGDELEEVELGGGGVVSLNKESKGGTRERTEGLLAEIEVDEEVGEVGGAVSLDGVDGSVIRVRVGLVEEGGKEGLVVVEENFASDGSGGVRSDWGGLRLEVSCVGDQNGIRFRGGVPIGQGALFGLKGCDDSGDVHEVESSLCGLYRTGPSAVRGFFVVVVEGSLDFKKSRERSRGLFWSGAFLFWRHCR